MSGAFSWTNKVLDDADSTVAVGAAQGSFTANAIDSAYPGTNAVDDSPSKRTRVNYQTSTSTPYESYLEANWTSNATVRVVAALDCRLASTIVGVRFAVLNSGGSTVETTTQITQAQLVPIPGTTDRYNVFAVLSANASVNRLRFQVQVSASANTYYEVGHLWAGPAIVWPGGVGVEWALGGVDASKVVRGYGGGYAAYEYPTRRVLSITKRGLAYADALGDPNDTSALSLREAIFTAGLSSPVVCISSDRNAHRLQVGSVYGLLTQMPSIEHYGNDRFGTAATIEEIR